MNRVEIAWVAFVGIAWAILAALVVRDLATTTTRETRRLAAVVCALAVASAAYRLLVVPPAFVHAEFYGPELVTDILRFPAPPRHPHGAAPYGLLHVLSAALGRTAEGIVRANVVVAAVTTLPFAWLAARLANDPRAAVLAAALWASSPLIERLACSEDAHVTGALFALSAAAAADHAAKSGARSSSAFALASAQLMVFSRQSFYAVMPLVVLLAARARRRRWFVALSATLVLGLALQRATRADEGYRILLMAYRLLASDVGAIARLLAGHPALAVTRLSVVVPLLAIVGLVALARDRERRVAVFVGLAATTLSSLPAAWPAYGASYGFRLPQYALWLASAAVGATVIVSALDRLVARSSARLSSSGAFAALTLVVVGSGYASAAARENRRRDAQFDEYVWMRDELARRPGLPVLVAAMDFPAPRYHTPAEVAAILGRETRDVAAATHGYFVDGLGCHASTVAEGLYPDAHDEQEVGRRLEREPETLASLLFDASSGFGLAKVPPVTRRRACDALAAHGVVVASGPVLDLRSFPPDQVYALESIQPRLLRIER